MTEMTPNSYRTGPDEKGLFGIYGGRFVAETLMPLILQLEQAYKDAKADPAFAAEFDDLLEHYVGRPSPLYFAERLTEHRHVVADFAAAAARQHQQHRRRRVPSLLLGGPGPQATATTRSCSLRVFRRSKPTRPSTPGCGD